MPLADNSTVKPRARSELKRRYFHKGYLWPWVLVILVPVSLRLVMFYDITFPFQLSSSDTVVMMQEELQLYKLESPVTQDAVKIPINHKSQVIRPDEDAWITHDEWINHGKDPLKKPSLKGTESERSTDLPVTKRPSDQDNDALNFGLPEDNEEENMDIGVDEDQLREIGARIELIKSWTGQTQNGEKRSKLKGEDEEQAEEKQRGNRQRGYEVRQGNEEIKAINKGEAAKERTPEEEMEVDVDMKIAEERKATEEREATEEKEATEEREAAEKRKATEENVVDEENKASEGKKERTAEETRAVKKTWADDERTAEETRIVEKTGADEERRAVEEREADGEREGPEERKAKEEKNVAEERVSKDEDSAGERQAAHEKEAEQETKGFEQPEAEGEIKAGECDLFDGDWEYDPDGPLYTNATCFFIRGDHNCMSNGRPDTDFLNWRWKPRGCDLPRFDAKAFMEAFKGKTIGFVGDSLARNQMQSLLCMLSLVEVPILLRDDDLGARWLYEQYQVNLVAVWSPYLLKESQEGVIGFEKGQIVLYLDVLDPVWTDVLPEFEIVILSVGQWYFKPAVYVMQDEVIGCHYCPDLNLTQFSFFEAYSAGLRLALERVAAEWKGTALVSTFASAHGERRSEDDPEQCRRQRPLEQKEYDSSFLGMNKEMRDVVWGEYSRTLSDQSKQKNDVHIDFLDVSKLSLLRPDGHPGPFVYANPFEGRNPDEWVSNDCLHWCLPGPIDTWNQLLVKLAQKYF